VKKVNKISIARYRNGIVILWAFERFTFYKINVGVSKKFAKINGDFNVSAAKNFVSGKAATAAMSDCTS